MSNPALHSKLPQVGTTIFTVMSQLAAEHEAINLSQGFPDFDPPEALMQRLNHYMQQGMNQYAPMMGVPALRHQIALKTERLYGFRPDMDTEITLTSGATEALFAAITALVRPGDQVIVFDPAYDSYEPAIQLAGGRAVHIPLAAPEFGIDWQQVEDALNDNTRLIILNSPHNPSGAVLAESDIMTLQSLVQKHGFYVISDEVYEHIIFDGLPHLSLLRFPDLAARSLVISSFGKTYHTTGWKVGYCVAPAELTTEFRKIHQYITFCTMTPAQYAYSDFLQSCPEHYLALPEFYQQKRDIFCQAMAASRFKFSPAKGTYFQCLDYSDISDLADTEFANYLTIEHGLASIPISVFYKNPPEQKVLRFCFAKSKQVLEQTGEILCQI